MVVAGWGWDGCSGLGVGWCVVLGGLAYWENYNLYEEMCNTQKVVSFITV